MSTHLGEPDHTPHGQGERGDDMLLISRKRLVEIESAEIERLRRLVEAAQPYVQACISHPYIGGDGPRKWLLDKERIS